MGLQGKRRGSEAGPRLGVLGCAQDGGPPPSLPLLSAFWFFFVQCSWAILKVVSSDSADKPRELIVSTAWRCRWSPGLRVLIPGLRLGGEGR